MAVLLVVAVYLLALELFDRRVALVASLFTAVFPHFISIANAIDPEATYTAFLTLSLALFAISLRKKSYLFAVLTGISFAIAYLSRSAAFMVMGVVFLCVTAVQGKQFYRAPAVRLIVAATLMFVVVASPYLFFLREHYGAFVISPKTSYVMIWMKSRIYHDNDNGEIGNEELWGLNSEGKLRWQEPKGIGDLAGYLMSHPGKSLAVYLHNLSMEIPGRIPNNSGSEAFPQVFPLYFALAALFALFRPWGGAAREKRSVLLAPFVMLLILPLFTEGWWKYLVAYAPLLIILAAKGLCHGSEWVAAKIDFRRKSAIQFAVLVAVVGVIMVRFQVALNPKSSPAPSANNMARLSLAEESRKAGLWAAHRFGPGKNYMVSWSKIIYYLNGLWTPYPVADYGEVLAFARANRVDFIVMEIVGERYSIEQLMKTPPGIQLADLYVSTTLPYAVAFYRLTN